MKYNKINNEEKELIANTVLESIINDAQEVYRENKLLYRNGFHQMKWDFVATRITNNLKQTRFYTKKISRGIFSFVIIVDQENKTVYNIMRKSNIRLIKAKNKPTHYLWALTTINDDINIEEGQMSLFYMEEAKEVRETTKRQLLAEVDDVIDRYATIVINDDNKQFPSIELHILDMNLNTVYQETWKDSVDLESILDYVKENDEENYESPLIRLKNDEEKIKINTKDKKENKREEGK